MARDKNILLLSVLFAGDLNFLIAAQSTDELAPELEELTLSCGWFQNGSESACTLDQRPICSYLLSLAEVSALHPIDIQVTNNLCHASPPPGPSGPEPLRTSFNSHTSTSNVHSVHFRNDTHLQSTYPSLDDMFTKLLYHVTPVYPGATETSDFVRVHKHLEFCKQLRLQNKRSCNREELCVFDERLNKCSLDPVRLNTKQNKNVFAMLITGMSKCGGIEIKDEADKQICLNQPGISLLDITIPEASNLLLYISSGCLTLYLICALLCPMPQRPKNRRSSKIRTSLGENLDMRFKIAR